MDNPQSRDSSVRKIGTQSDFDSMVVDVRQRIQAELAPYFQHYFSSGVFGKLIERMDSDGKDIYGQAG